MSGTVDVSHDIDDKRRILGCTAIVHLALSLLGCVGFTQAKLVGLFYEK